jgi:hypothetical protein
MEGGSGRSCIALALLLVACQTEVFPPDEGASHAFVANTPEPKVVLFVIDGPRYVDSFGDSLRIDGIWNTLRPQGTLCSNFRNLGATLTVSGHAAMLTGGWQTLNNDGLEHPQNPTLFEYYRKATGAPLEDAVLVSGKPKLNACVYSLDPAYGAVFAGLADTGHATDFATYDRLIQRLGTDRPHFVMASFSQVDQKAHSGVWSEYVRQIEIVDSLVVLTWNYLQSDPVYAGQTTMFITADHGRHDDAHGGFQNHGDACAGCQHVIFLALGPDIRAGYETATPYTSATSALPWATCSDSRPRSRAASSWTRSSNRRRRG